MFDFAHQFRDRGITEYDEEESVRSKHTQGLHHSCDMNDNSNKRRAFYVNFSPFYKRMELIFSENKDARNSEWEAIWYFLRLRNNKA